MIRMKYIVTLNGKNYEVEVEETDAVVTAVTDAAAAQPAAPAPAAPAAPAPAAPVGDGVKVTAPMPGNILDVRVSVGQTVKRGEVMFILEAMKMENDIVAPQDGTVRQILANKGAAVNTDQVLATI